LNPHKFFSGLTENEKEEARRFMEISEVAALLEQLTLLSSKTADDEIIYAQEFINFEFELDLNNPYEPTDEDIINSLPSEDQQDDLDDDMVDCDDVIQQVGLDAADRALVTLQTFLEQ
jgi:hypothetical protein